MHSHIAHLRPSICSAPGKEQARLHSTPLRAAAAAECNLVKANSRPLANLAKFRVAVFKILCFRIVILYLRGQNTSVGSVLERIPKVSPKGDKDHRCLIESYSYHIFVRSTCTLISLARTKNSSGGDMTAWAWCPS